MPKASRILDCEAIGTTKELANNQPAPREANQQASPLSLLLGVDFYSLVVDFADMPRRFASKMIKHAQCLTIWG